MIYIAYDNDRNIVTKSSSEAYIDDWIARFDSSLTKASITEDYEPGVTNRYESDGTVTVTRDTEVTLDDRLAELEARLTALEEASNVT